jgi:PKD repeat protein
MGELTRRLPRHRLRPAAFALLAGLLLATTLVAGRGAEAQKVFNPGPFNFRITGGLVDINGTSFNLTPSEFPQCSDGRDNDDDGLTDFPADPQCTAANDDSELAPGFQPKEDTTISGTITGTGAISIPQSGIYFPPAYLDASGSILTARIQPTGPATGNLNPLTGAATLNVSLRVKLEGSPSGISLGSSCFIGPLALNVTTGTTSPPPPNTPISGVPYDPANGTGTLVNNSFSVPGASGCGPLGLANGPINDQLGLPSAAGRNTAILEGVLNPIIGKGVNADFSTSVSTGPAPLTVNVNGTLSNAARPITSYAWNFGNGQTATGATAFTTYSTPGTYDITLTVTDADGDVDVRTRQVTVTEPANVPPTAVIGASGTSGNAPFTVSLSGSGSSDPDGSIVSYAWNFGNGQTASGENVSVTYTQAGTYTVTLTVTDDRGATGTATRTITVAPRPNTPPTAVAQVVSVSGSVPLVVNLSGANSSDPDGTIVSYAWDFGNGQTATGVTTQVTYTTEGLYTVVLTVTDNQGATGSQSLLIDVSTDPNIAPTAAIDASATSGTAPLTVSLDGSGSTDVDGTIVAYAWNFGNGQAGSGPTASATYTIPGTYTVTLTVTDNRGATGTATTVVTVSPPPNQPPTASVAATPSSGTVPLLVQFSSAGSSDPDGAITGYSWSFGNGQTSTSPNPSVVYTTPGVYTATLTVTDNSGATAARSTTVTVNAANQPPVPVIAAAPLSGAAPLVVNLNGAGSSDPDGSIVSYSWNLGNGQTATGPVAQATYTNPGSYTIRLTVVDDRGASRSTTTTVVAGATNLRPVAVLSALPTSGPAPLLVQLSSAGSNDPDGNIVSYTWDFGNGQTANGPTTQVSYGVAGTYVVTLTVTDNRGGTATATETIVVDPPLPLTDRVRIQFRGGLNYSYDGAVNGGTLRVARDGFGILSVSGSAPYTGPGGSSATISAGLSRFLIFNAFSGAVRVDDPDNGVNNVATNLLLSPLTSPSQNSARGSANGTLTNPTRNYSLSFTIDDRVT